jgi:hypothetical protein
MFPHKVNKTVSICQRLKRAAINWTLQKRNNPFNLEARMLSSDMKLKTLLRKTFIFTSIGWTLMRKITFTFSTMHIHRGR